MPAAGWCHSFHFSAAVARASDPDFVQIFTHPDRFSLHTTKLFPSVLGLAALLGVGSGMGASCPREQLGSSGGWFTDSLWTGSAILVPIEGDGLGSQGDLRCVTWADTMGRSFFSSQESLSRIAWA